MSDEWIRDSLKYHAGAAIHHMADLLRVLGVQCLDEALFVAAFVSDGFAEPSYEDGRVPTSIEGPLLAVSGSEDSHSAAWLDRQVLPSADPDQIRQWIRELAGSEHEVIVSWGQHHLDNDQRHFFSIVAVSLNAAELATYPRLPEGDVGERSLVERTLHRFAQVVASLGEHSQVTPAESVRRCAGEFLSQFDGGDIRHLFRAPLGLDTLADLSAIAAQRYEGSDPNARLVLHKSRAPAMEVDLLVPVPLESHRLVRKLLEACRPTRGALVSVNLRVVGRVREPGPEDSYVRFRPQGVWEFYSRGVPLLSVRNGQPRMPASCRVREAGPENLRRDFPYFPNPQGLSELLERLADGGHGATLVVAEDAVEEGSRLRGQATLLTASLPIEEALLDDLSSVDGAILVDGHGRIVAFGVVLDGLAGDPPGLASRGSRYNSAFNYVRTRTRLVEGRATEKARTTTAIVVSADGSVDWITRFSIEAERGQPPGNSADRTQQAALEDRRRLLGEG